MTESDMCPRSTPYEIGIPGRDFARGAFDAIREEAGARGVDPSDPGAFILLGQVGRAIREIQGEERGEEAIHRFGAFLFHSYHFHEAGERLCVLDREAARYLIDGVAVDGGPVDGGPVDAVPDVSDWKGELPWDAGYLQLPRHLFWTDAEIGGHAEPLDGVFWTRAAGDHLALLVTMGIRADRPGLSLTELPPVPLADASGWPKLEAREEGEDFETRLPGGELDRLYSIVTLAEVLKLMALVFAYISQAPGAMVTGSDGDPQADRGAESGGPRSTLPYRRIRLVDDSSRPGDPSSNDDAEGES